jgi:hypothetical protein
MHSHCFDDGYYSILLLVLVMKQQVWLAEEYQEGTIIEKQFLEALVIETPDRLLPNDEDQAVA